MVDPRAESGFREGERYERARPSYPTGHLDELAGQLGLGPGSTILDLAAGTGKVTRLLIPLAGRVIAVDPSTAMLDELRRQVPEAETLEGTAEAIPLPEESVDAVFVAEAFHWFSTGPALAEIARVLVPGGGLALLWNHPAWDEATFPWVAEFGARMASLREAYGSMPIDDGDWTELVEARFAPLTQTTAEHVQHLDREGFVTMVSSWTWIANLPDADRERQLAEIRDLLPDEELALPWVTNAYVTHRPGP
jgi:ubiquinone/menaquinone biosynthesis C-methylase UbiE